MEMKIESGGASNVASGKSVISRYTTYCRRTVTEGSMFDVQHEVPRWLWRSHGHRHALAYAHGQSAMSDTRHPLGGNLSGIQGTGLRHKYLASSGHLGSHWKVLS